MKIFRKVVGLGLVAAVLMFTITAGIGATMDFTGTVEQKGEIVVLFTPDDTYVLKGSDMLPQMIGKKVKVTGTVEEKDEMKILTVEEFEVVVKE